MEEDRITITFLEVTTMDCTDHLGADVIAFESAVATAMQSFQSFTIDDNRLRIQYGAGDLLFRRLSD